MNQTNLRISGVVVLYNPEESFIENLKSYLHEVNNLFIIDNSPKKNDFICRNIQFLNNIKYDINSNNPGIGITLNIAIKKALDEGYKYVLTMDQDSKFEESALKKLISKIEDENIGIYSPFHKNKYFTNPPITQEIEEVSDVMTSGNILNLEAVKKIGLFREDYFIDYVDVEYCLRLRKNGYKILRVNNSFLVHNEANLSKKSFFGKTVYPPNHKPFRWYYKIRNYLYLKQEYQINFPEYFKKESKNIRNNIIKVVLFEQNKILKLKMMIKGYLHYRKHITGKLPE
ncbi:MAG: glycosyltransferase family 2 protein [Ignavibacterium sp.]|jgi:rhamnosyltransferase|nr:glycosyltransferase family 2 protein [Ignavibacterium sp.]